MPGRTFRRARWATLCAGLGVLLLASASGAAPRVGVGKMLVTPTRVTAGSTNDLSFTFTADSAPLVGTTLVDVPRGWTKPQRSSPSAPGYVELQPAGCLNTSITGVANRRIVIDTHCPRRHLFRLLYHRAVAPLIAADGFDFLTQTRKAGVPKKVPFAPLGPQKQPVVKVRGAAPKGLFMTVTSIATVGTTFSATVRGVDQWQNNAPDYTGTVTLTSSDPAATLPAPYAYVAKDAAQHTFTGIVLHTVGTQTITATDSNGFTVTSGPITVNASG
jgi:hypothetical protein